MARWRSGLGLFGGVLRGIAPCGMTRTLAQPLALLSIELLFTTFGCLHALEGMNDALPIASHTSHYGGQCRFQVGMSVLTGGKGKEMDCESRFCMSRLVSLGRFKQFDVLWFEPRTDYLITKEQISHQDSGYLLPGHEDVDQFDRIHWAKQQRPQ